MSEEEKNPPRAQIFRFFVSKVGTKMGRIASHCGLLTKYVESAFAKDTSEIRHFIELINKDLAP